MIKWNKSTGGQDCGPSSCTPTHASSVNNPGAKTLIKYEIDESLDIKEETVQDQQNKSESNKSTETQDCGPISCTPTHISSDNNPGSKTLIKYEIDESIDIKEEILQDEELHQPGKHNLHSGKNQSDEKYVTTGISSDSNFGTKTVIEYDIDDSLDIKDEITQVPEGHQQMEHSLLSGKIQWAGKCITTIVSCDNNTRPKTLIEYEDDTTLEIKEEIIRDQRNVEQELGGKKEKLHESKGEPKKKYNCEKCPKSYLQKQSLYTHRKYECGVMPQFSCEFCGRAFKRKSYVNKHILCVHQKTNSIASQMLHNCNECSRIYSSLSALDAHKCEEHTVVKPQFICDYCGFQTERKKYLFKHITSRHFQKIDVSITIPEKKYNCKKCARSYFLKSSFSRHKKFECGVIPQFTCESCGKQFKRKSVMNKHILRVHQRTDTEASHSRHNCEK